MDLQGKHGRMACWAAGADVDPAGDRQAPTTVGGSCLEAQGHESMRSNGEIMQVVDTRCMEVAVQRSSDQLGGGCTRSR